MSAGRGKPSAIVDKDEGLGKVTSPNILLYAHTDRFAMHIYFLAGFLGVFISIYIVMGYTYK